MYLQDRYNYIISAELSELDDNTNKLRTKKLDMLLNIYQGLFTIPFDIQLTYGTFEDIMERSFIVSAPFQIVENERFEKVLKQVCFILFGQYAIIRQDRQGKFQYLICNGRKLRCKGSVIKDTIPLQGNFTYLPKQNKYIQLYFE